MAIDFLYSGLQSVEKGSSGIALIYETIENYIYFYHTDTLILLPNSPAEISDRTNASWGSTPILGRSAPIKSYQNSGPRSISISLEFHRELLKQSNSSNLYNNPKNLQGWGEDYIDYMTNMMYGAVIPNYASSSKMVDPPLVAARFGNQIYIKGVISSLDISYSGAILRDNNYSIIKIGFGIDEVNPYDALTAMGVGGYRSDGAILMNTDLGRAYNIGKTSGSGQVVSKYSRANGGR